MRILPAHFGQLALELGDTRSIEPRGETVVGKNRNRQEKKPNENSRSCSHFELIPGTRTAPSPHPDLGLHQIDCNLNAGRMNNARSLFPPCMLCNGEWD